MDEGCLFNFIDFIFVLLMWMILLVMGVKVELCVMIKIVLLCCLLVFCNNFNICFFVLKFSVFVGLLYKSSLGFLVNV